jgi:hypothetical protein
VAASETPGFRGFVGRLAQGRHLAGRRHGDAGNGTETYAFVGDPGRPGRPVDLCSPVGDKGLRVGETCHGRRTSLAPSMRRRDIPGASVTHPRRASHGSHTIPTAPGPSPSSHDPAISEAASACPGRLRDGRVPCPGASFTAPRPFLPRAPARPHRVPFTPGPAAVPAAESVIKGESSSIPPRDRRHR